MVERTLGVVVMAYGTPGSPAEIESYYTHIRRGHPPAPEQLEELTARYRAIGGVSPLATRTEAQRAELSQALEELAPGRCRVVLGQKHAAPFIEDAVAALADDGCHAVVGLVLAPHFSGASVGQYLERLAAAATDHGLPWAGVKSWHTEPSYLSFLSRSIQAELASLPARTLVLFTAHSLPERVLAEDPYADQLQQSAAEVAARAQLEGSRTWALAWQSAGRTPEPWRGPDILAVLDDVARGKGADGVLVCPQGFVSDHLEVLYDLDIEARAKATELGLAFARTAVLNADPDVFSALAGRVLDLAP